MVSAKGSYRVVFQFPLMQVDDVGAHTIQEVLRVRDEHEDSLEPDNEKQDNGFECQCVLTATDFYILKKCGGVGKDTYELSSSSNHTQASRSRWLVGSSSNSMKGLMNRALDK